MIMKFISFENLQMIVVVSISVVDPKFNRKS